VSNTNRQDLADRQAVVDQARCNHSVDATHHIMATIDVDVDGDQATARAELDRDLRAERRLPARVSHTRGALPLSGCPHVGTDGACRGWRSVRYGRPT
jgi:hypothetical protein